MNILALETSGDFCSVALWRDGAVEDRELPAQQKQSGLLLELVHEVFSAAGVTLAAVDGIAFGAGPGSFTGLRIACGVAQGLALGADKPVVGIGTLQAMAQASRATRVTCCIDARMGEVYQASYEMTFGDWRTVQEAGVYAPAEVPLLPDDGWMGCGSGFATYRDLLCRRYGVTLSGVNDKVHARARDVAQLAAPLFARGGGQAAECAAPLYVRDRVALKTSER